MLRSIGSVTFLTLFLVGCGGGDGTPTAIEVGASRGMAITSGPPPGGTVGVAYSSRRCGRGGCGGGLSASGGIGSYTWGWAAAPGSSLPPGLSLTGNVISGTPPVGSVGSYSVIVTATDSGTPPGAAMQPYTITIVNPAPPGIAASPGPHGATLNQPYSYQFQASGLAPVSFSEVGALPPGLVPLTATGHLAGLPTTANSYPITVQATDAAGQRSAAQAFTINVFMHGFSPTGVMQAARSGHTATLLASGEVLVSGGESPAGGVIASELFDPTTGRFATTAALRVAREGHTATLLCDLAAPPCSNPKVLIVGGGILASTASAELYDPMAGTFTLTAGSLATARGNHTATLLSSGKVLIAGGTTDGVTGLASAELFDPATGTFSATAAPMAHARRTGHSATLLPDGRVLIAGGDDVTSGDLDSAELYDPIANTFSTVPSPMTVARIWHTATLLPGGKVLIAGGDSLGSPAELYDPAAVAPTASFTATGSLVTPRTFHNAVLLPSGQVLIAGGVYYTLACCQALQHAELYDPASGSFASTGGMQTGRIGFTLTLLDSTGQVLVVGGNDSNSPEGIATAEIYQ